MARRLRCCWVVAALLLGCSSSSDDGASGSGAGGSGSGTDPFEPLRVGLTASAPLKCNGDRCCFRDCSGNNDIICTTRLTEDVKRLTKELGQCESIVFPEWFYANDCFVWEPWTATRGLADWERIVLQCFCGRTGTAISGGWSQDIATWHKCDLSAEPPEAFVADLDQKCAKTASWCEASSCTKKCSGRVCGPDTCGGSCGTCSSGTCTASGQCSSSGGNCSSCLSSCHGMSSCCTGCGCLCESACGQCF